MFDHSIVFHPLIFHVRLFPESFNACISFFASVRAALYLTSKQAQIGHNTHHDCLNQNQLSLRHSKEMAIMSWCASNLRSVDGRPYKGIRNPLSHPKLHSTSYTLYKNMLPYNLQFFKVTSLIPSFIPILKQKQLANPIGIHDHNYYNIFIYIGTQTNSTVHCY